MAQHCKRTATSGGTVFLQPSSEICAYGQLQVQIFDYKDRHEASGLQR